MCPRCSTWCTPSAARRHPDADGLAVTGHGASGRRGRDPARPPDCDGGGGRGPPEHVRGHTRRSGVRRRSHIRAFFDDLRRLGVQA